MEGGVFLSYIETAVHDYVAQFEQLVAEGVLEHLFETVACVALDGLVSAFLDEAGQGDEAFGMEHRITSREGNVHVSLFDEAEQLVHRHGFSTVRVPRLGILTPDAKVLTPRAVERGAKSYAIDGCSVLDIEYTNIICG